MIPKLASQQIGSLQALHKGFIPAPCRLPVPRLVVGPELDSSVAGRGPGSWLPALLLSVTSDLVFGYHMPRISLPRPSGRLGDIPNGTQLQKRELKHFFPSEERKVIQGFKSTSILVKCLC